MVKSVGAVGNEELLHIPIYFVVNVGVSYMVSEELSGIVSAYLIQTYLS
jgi:hypothetical protein